MERPDIHVVEDADQDYVILPLDLAAQLIEKGHILDRLRDQDAPEAEDPAQRTLNL